MKVFSKSVPFRKEEDIQIQTGAVRLYFEVALPNGVTLAQSAASIRLRNVSSITGAETIIDRTDYNLQMLFEVAAFTEGFIRTNYTPSADPENWYTAKGFVELSDKGALAPDADSYLSLDYYTPGHNTNKLEIWAIGAPDSTDEYIRYNPFVIQSATKEIPLAGIDKIVLNPGNIGNLQLQFSGRSVDYDSVQLRAMGCMLNDLVSVDDNGKIIAGIESYLVLDVKDCIRCVIEPSVTFINDTITVWMLSGKKLR